jgi:hypothetical protein
LVEVYIALPLPPMVVTTALTALAACAGVTAVICVAELTTKDVAAAPPKVTLVAPDRFVPVIVTLCPPPRGPAFGERLVIAGAPLRDPVLRMSWAG